MAKRTFQEIIAELGAITSEYSEMVVNAHETSTPFTENEDAYEQLILMRDRLDALMIPILELPDYKDRTIANERVTVMMNVVGSSISSIEDKGFLSALTEKGDM